MKENEDNFVKIFKIIIFLIPLLAYPGLVNAQNAPLFHKNTEFNQFVVGALTYTSVAGACAQGERYFELKSALVRLLEREFISKFNSSRCDPLF
jgi:hypothetical protein